MLSAVPSVDLERFWTPADLALLPDDADPRSYEIVDGLLVVSPSAGWGHEMVSAEVRNALLRAVPQDLAVLGPAGVDLAPSYRVPDLVVVPRDLSAPRNRHVRPAEILLAVEVVSPGSVTTDRITKPAQYAAAGIGSYWRVETDPISLTAYDLDGTTYREVGTWGAGDIARLTAPFAVEIEIDRLV